MPEGDPSRVGYTEITDAFGPGAPGALQVVAPAAELDEVASTLRHDPGIAAVMPVQQAGSTGLIEAILVAGPSTPTLGTTVDRLRGTLPDAALIGGAAAENHDLESASRPRRRW